MRTFASLMDLSQSVVFLPFFPGNWLLGHSVSSQMKPNHCPWNFIHLTWRLFYCSPAERDWFYQCGLFGVFIVPYGKSRRKNGCFYIPVLGNGWKYVVSECRTVIRISFTLLSLFYKGMYFDIRQSSIPNFCCCPYTSTHHANTRVCSNLKEWTYRRWTCCQYCAPSCIRIRYIDKTYMEFTPTSVVEATLAVSGILCAFRKSKNVQLV
jgi:hypothetical protein